MRPAWPMALALLALSCGAGAGEDRPPNVVLVVLDTVRADHLSCYGYPLPTTPHLDALCESADRYVGARSTAPWTLPSHASMFTGRYPFQHGAQARKTPKGRIHDALPLKKRHRTLAEALLEAGYRTGAFVANEAYLMPAFQLDQGFEVYDQELQRGPEVNARALAWLDQVGEPFFLFVNYMDAHRPYNVAPIADGRELPAADPANPNRLLDELCAVVLETDEPPSPELVRRVITQYDHGIANVDLAVGALVEHLRAADRWEDTLFIVTSDHGEYFGEHDVAEHSKDVYEEALHVPLIVKRPGQVDGRVMESRFTLVGIPGLVWSHLPSELAEGGAGFPVVEGSDEPAFAELRYTREKDLGASYGQRFMRERYVIYLGRYKLIRSTDGRDELYDLSEDPREQHDLIASEPELATRLRAVLEDFMARNEDAIKTGEPPEFSEEELQALRDLGYFGSAVREE